MEPKNLSLLKILLVVQGIWQFLGGLGLCIISIRLTKTATEPLSSSESFGAGMIFLLLVGAFLMAYSMLFLIAGWKIWKSESGRTALSVIACVAGILQGLFAATTVVSAAAENPSIVAPICLILVFPFCAIVGIYGLVIQIRNI